MQKAHDREVVGFRYFGRDVSSNASTSAWPLPCIAPWRSTWIMLPDAS